MNNEYELISIDGEPKTAEKIREFYNNKNEYPTGYYRAVEKGADAVRKFFNDKNLRKRRLIK